MKKAYFFLFIFLFPVFLSGQQPDTVSVKTDSLPVKKDSSILFKDTASVKTDTVAAKPNLPASPAVLYSARLNEILKQNIYLNSTGSPVVMISKERATSGTGLVFYILLVAVGLLAFFRFAYTRYFNNLFRVFFNTSLRQSQLTDQLLQSKQASLFFNLLFTITGGIYIYFLLRYYYWLTDEKVLSAILACIAGLLVIYMLKFIVLKFTGWVTNHTAASNTYIFIIFLINKILGVLLVPFIIVIAFADDALRNSAVLISLLLVGMMFLLRFFRSFGLLQHQIRVSRFHFFLYIAGVEILPLLLIYKGLLVLLSKKL